MSKLNAGDLIVQKIPSWRWWVMRGDLVTGEEVHTRAGDPATVLQVDFSPDAPSEGWVDAVVGGQVVRSYIKMRDWRRVWEVA